MRKPITSNRLILLAVVAIASFAFFHYGRAICHSVYLKYHGARTVDDVIDRCGEAANARLAPAFSRAGVTYPPAQVALLGLKTERALEVWALEQEEWHFIKVYPIKGASGIAGPKLREGDRQVPEGVYRIIALNPNSSYHLSMKLDYPNDFDLRHAREEGRSEPGGNIFIHGDTESVGCLAMGDQAIEELFVLVEEVGKDNAKVVIAPHDPRTAPLPRSLPNAPAWLPELYGEIEEEFKAFTESK